MGKDKSADSLTLTIKAADNILMLLFFNCSEKIRFDISCELSALMMICMKC